jgi:hypothetical protein
MTALLYIFKLNHHNIQQQNRKELYDILQLILKNSEVIPHCNYLSSYINAALECFVFKKSILTNNQIITIINKNKLKNILSFISKRDSYGLEYMNKLSELYNHI